MRASLSPACLPTGAKPASSVDPWGVPPGTSTHSSSTSSDSWAAPQQPAHGAEKTADAWAAASAAKPAATSGEPTLLPPGSLEPLGPRRSPPPASLAWGLSIGLHLLPSSRSLCPRPPATPPLCGALTGVWHRTSSRGSLQALPAGRAPAPLCLHHHQPLLQFQGDGGSMGRRTPTLCTGRPSSVPAHP